MLPRRGEEAPRIISRAASRLARGRNTSVCASATASNVRIASISFWPIRRSTISCAPAAEIEVPAPAQLHQRDRQRPVIGAHHQNPPIGRRRVEPVRGLHRLKKMPPRFAVGDRVAGDQQFLAAGPEHLAQRRHAVRLQRRLQGRDGRLGGRVVGGPGLQPPASPAERPAAFRPSDP